MKYYDKNKAPSDDQGEFWETAFAEKQAMWGMEPSRSALLAKDIFIRDKARTILVPGIGYGRNAKVFTDEGMKVTGIEISETAIELLKKYYGEEMTIYQGGVNDMPFDDKKYDGIFCYALIHLLNKADRIKLLRDCFNQLAPGGSMVFSVISKTAPTYGKGKKISEDQYELVEGAPVYFYGRESIEAEFGEYGLVEILEIDEKPPKHSEYERFPFYFVVCGS
ncbi:MAG: class I SAM-dependent methyltransferase [Bacteroidota bacterium]